MKFDHPLRRNLIRGSAVLAATLVLAACGVAPEGATDPEGSDDGASLGQEQQPDIFVLNGYGVDGVMNRCWFDASTPKWGGGKCLFPATKKIFIDANLRNCGGPFGADYVAAMKTAYQYVTSELALNGFTVTNDALGGNKLLVNVDCANPGITTPADTLGHTNFGGIDGSTGGGCTSTTHGSACKYFSAAPRLFRSRIETGSFLTAVSSARRVFLDNLFRHEMLHAAGLGHDRCGANPLTQVMGSSACMNLQNPQSWSLARLVKFERDALFAYRAQL